MMGGVRTKKMTLIASLFALLAGIALAASPASAQKAPDPFTQEVLIKATLMTFNDANVTGNYAVLHAKLSKPFRDQFPPEKLAAAFKIFRDNRIDFDLVVAKPPIASQPSRVSEQGVLMLYGYFDTTPSRVHYELEYIMSDGEWKPIRINVNLKQP
jgi:opacity protein-like surface antigen